MFIQKDGRILIDGFFTEVGGQPRAGIARLTSSSVLAVSSRQPAATLEAWPNPVTDQLHLRLDKAARPGRVVLLDLMGKTVYTTSATGAEMQLLVRQLAAGIYLLRVEYAAGPVTRRVVVE